MSDIKTKLEKHFKDAVDIEFTIQNRKLWILNARPAKKTGPANLKITIDLFFEKVIDINEVISRLRFQDIDEVLTPTIENENELEILEKGLPASPGASTGKIFFDSESIVQKKGNSCILCRIEVSPEDLNGICISEGVITSRGGMTSHAAVVSRRIGKPCISGIGSLNINWQERKASINGYIINEGDWITINGSLGNLYMGKGNVVVHNWKNNKHLFIFSRIIEKAICTNILNDNNVGKVWIFRDYFLHNIPFHIKGTEKKSIANSNYKSFSHPIGEKIQNIYKNLIALEHEGLNIKLILQGLRNSLLRQLSNKIGIGNHYKYYRPLLDPMCCVRKGENDNNLFYQLIGEEFFNIGKYIPNLIDIYKVKVYYEIRTDSEDELSFLDFTNPNGESIVLKCNNVISIYIEINEQIIKLNDLPKLYNIFRKREYFWTWYSENLTSHKELVEFLNKPKKDRINNFRLNTYAHELELLKNDSLTKSGEALKMEKLSKSPQFQEIENRISNTISKVCSRGFDENEELYDDYSELIEKYEYKNAIIVGIYENYFPPKRHEFELQLITDIIEAVINSKFAIFTLGAAASGLIGDTFTYVVKKLLSKIIEGFKGQPNEENKFKAILSDVEKIEKYFNNEDKEEIKVLVEELEIEKERLVPLLKLLGYKTKKKKDKRFWIKSGA